MTAIIRPATFHDFLQHDGAQDPLTWQVLLRMQAGGLSWALDDDAGLAAMAGIFPVARDAAELWFWCRPRAGRHLWRILSQARLTMQALPYSAFIMPKPSPQGAVMARRLGFAPETIDGTEVWTCRS